ncbi:caspase family protein [Flammeovirga kamogawensis]|uniref:Caspase family protein n=1 Tax=Flammeovirga kamogawensis TaxID=373891 RepID=A0ABX8GQH2_9BACT|nr:caspase family protein [Flammeovirga kamogawensis]MBB6463486.1 putative caspase-like protein/predicted Zn-dependent protease [Flammeovirga kamogawensis]QWG05588.1 caspase family protein [Flammeovirga kamogawensis]TRX67420.1 hypothetical protein EO216_04390 [Flammeovirga kamogawensis]
MRFFTFFTLLCCLILPSFAQESRGLVLNADQKEKKNIKAIIVGVSTYENLSTAAQLKYANKDAEAFANFLTQHAHINPSNIHLFLDNKATAIQVWTSIRKELSTAKEGDQLIFYFAGHGDVDAMTDNAYLLTHDASSPEEKSFYMMTSIDVSMLQKMVSKMTAMKKFHVLMITDACRSGHILSTDGLSDQTLTSLIADWNNTNKLVSCAPNQLSYEGIEWGNGHGAFTHFLLKGLMGEADIDENNAVDLGELYDYTRGNVRRETKGKQSPQYKGNDADILMTVDAKLLDLARQNNYNISGMEVASRAVNTTTSDPVENQKEELSTFLAAIDQHRLIPPKYIKATENTSISFSSTSKSYQHLESISTFNNKVLISFKNNTIEILDNSLHSVAKLKVDYDTPKLFTGNGEYWAFAGVSKTIARYLNNNLIAKADYHKASISALAISKEATIATGDEKGTIFIWKKESVTGEKLAKTQAAIQNITITNDGNYIATADIEGQLIVWDIKSKEKVMEAKVPVQVTREMVFVKEGTQLIIPNGRGVKVLDVVKKKLVAEIKLPNRHIPNRLMKLDENYILILGNKGQLLLLNSKDYAVKEMGQNPLGANAKVAATQNSFYAMSTSKLEQSELTIPLPYAEDFYSKIEESEHYSEQEKENAKGTLAIALQEDAQNIITPFILGTSVQPSINQIKEAIYQLDYAIHLYNNTPLITDVIYARKWFLEAYEIIIGNDIRSFPKAVALFNKIIEQQPNAAYPYNGIALVNQKLMELAKTKESVAKASSLMPKWTTPKSTLATTFIIEENYADAIKMYDEIIDIIPKNAKGYVGKAQVYQMMGYYQKAWGLLKEATLKAGADISIEETKAALLIDLGDLLEAEKLLNKLLKGSYISTSTYLSYVKLKEEFYDRQDRDIALLIDAQQLLLSAIELHPTNADLYAELGKLFTRYPNVFRVKSSEVYALFNQALLLAPFNQVALKNNAEYAYRVDGNMEIAKQATVMYSQMRANFSDLDLFIASIAYAQKDYKLMEGSCKAAMLKNPYKLENYKMLWNVYIQFDKTEELHKLYLMAKENLPKCPWFDYKYALYFKGMRENSKAIAYTKTSLKITPSYNFAKVIEDPSKGLSHLYSYDKQTNGKVFTAKGGFYIVQKNDFKGVIDYAGRLVVPIEYKHIQLTQNGYSILTLKDHSKQLTSPDGKILGGRAFQEIEFLECGLVKVRVNGKYGCLDRGSGKVVVPFNYEVITNGKWAGIPVACCKVNARDNDNSVEYYSIDGKCISCN